MREPSIEQEACPDCGYPVDACECASLYGSDSLEVGARREPIWKRDGSEGLPPAPVPPKLEDNAEASVFLFTCVECGRRWTSPPAPIRTCGCGGDVVGHEFEYAEYSRIRWYDDPREVDQR